MDPYRQAMELVRERDRDRFLADLFAPAAARKHLFALHAFNAEIVRIRDVVSDPTLGEIRQEWWREALAAGRGEGHPVAEALLATVRDVPIPVAPLRALIEARTFDLYNDPMPTLTDFEGYAGETSSALLQLGALILNGGSDPGAADAAGHGGVAMTLAAAMLRLPRDARARQLFLPKDRLDAHGVDLEATFAGSASPGLFAALAEFRALARDHLAKATTALTQLPAGVRAAFLPLALVELDLRRLERHRQMPLAPVPEAPQWRRQWRLWTTARRWGRVGAATTA